MKKGKQIITTSCRRDIATFPVAILAFVMNRKKEFLAESDGYFRAQ